MGILYVALVVCLVHLVFYHGDDFEVGHDRTPFASRHHNVASAVYYHILLKSLRDLVFQFWDSFAVAEVVLKALLSFHVVYGVSALAFASASDGLDPADRFVLTILRLVFGPVMIGVSHA
jgi:hypothetical protein